jgi:purine-binding chemotaxis protein CheW
MSVEEATLLVFQLDDESFALPVSRVLEIVDRVPVAPVPHAPPMVPGLVNVRGVILPFFDVRQRLGLAARDATPATRMVVFDAPQLEGPTRLAFEADAVERVVELDPAAVEDFPHLCAAWPPDCIAGVAHRDDALVIRLDPVALFRTSAADIPAIPQGETT